jgi:hypothetical protein
MTKIAGSGSISQRHGSADPDPDPDPDLPQNVMDPQHCNKETEQTYENLAGSRADLVTVFRILILRKWPNYLQMP